MLFRLRRDASSVGMLMNDLAGHLRDCSGHLAEALTDEPQERAERLTALHASDFAAQNAAHAVLRGLAASFVTPFDRVDVFRITWALRRCCARFEAAGDCLDLLGGEHLPRRLPALVHGLVRATEIVATMVPRLGAPGSLPPVWIELTMIVKQAAQAHRRCVAEVTAERSDPALLARQLELLEEVRRIVDAIEEIGDAVQTVVVRES